jgi:dTDP-4-dehydrorhamnose 3,5-epimerase
MRLIETPLQGVYILERSPLSDHRGSLERMYCDAEMLEALGTRTLRQINRTVTGKAGTVRGLHFQRPPHAELKVITCMAGKVYDVAVDLREGSPTFLKYHAEVLDGGEPRSLIIPEGCAHGFQTLTADCEMLYFHTASYARDFEAGVHPMDPAVRIAWPLPVSDLSDRDRSHPPLSPDYTGVVL